MKTSKLFVYSFIALLFSTAISCKKENTLAENQKNIKKNWKLEKYLVNSIDKTGSLVITGYDESYTDNEKYDRSFTDKNGNKIVQNGSFEFETVSKLHISGVGSIEFTNNNTASSSYYNIDRLSETELWYSYSNGNEKHEFHLTRK